ncbi:MAG: hypothetical protein HF975_02180 [ANME-2 cluster archaeon]|nr:hypothetical protein [ANME-2 cluster archaeon]
MKVLLLFPTPSQSPHPSQPFHRLHADRLKGCGNAAQFDLTYGLLQFFQYLNHTEINVSSNGWWPGPYRRELRKIMESGWKSDVKMARGLDGEIEKVFRERERLRG